VIRLCGYLPLSLSIAAARFSWSYQQVSVTAAQLFRLIGIHPVQISPLLPPPAWPGSRSVRRVRRSPSWTRLTC
jgi:hypothetical protein